ncbi:uncharacterized protein LOC141900581 [Tubulanus polymorphus]|uniref:uncharacterized protein LOC141900581 n=1 Tax=Tubulanus polymorphus TaxID=672921 RepID=UPI003DA34550
MFNSNATMYFNGLIAASLLVLCAGGGNQTIVKNMLNVLEIIQQSVSGINRMMVEAQYQRLKIHCPKGWIGTKAVSKLHCYRAIRIKDAETGATACERINGTLAELKSTNGLSIISNLLVLKTTFKSTRIEFSLQYYLNKKLHSEGGKLALCQKTRKHKKVKKNAKSRRVPKVKAT